MKINQIVPVLHRNDAIGESIISFHRFLKEKEDIESYIYASSSDCDAQIPVKAISELADEKDDISILHYALPSEASHRFTALKGKKVLVFHNITPPSYFRDIDDDFANILAQGYEEIKKMKDHCHLAIADSSYNKEILASYDYKDIIVYPVFIDFNRLNIPDKIALKRHLGDYLNILVLGRVAPNKKIEDAIRIFNMIKLKYHPRSRLWIVGKINDHKYYYDALVRLSSAWGLTDVIFTNKVTERELATFLRNSSLLLSMSEHEGFCVPVLEGFYSQIPVIAYGAGAVPETMGEGGIVFSKKEFPEIAELVLKTFFDKNLRKKIIDAQNERLEYFSHEAQKKRASELVNILKQL